MLKSTSTIRKTLHYRKFICNCKTCVQIEMINIGLRIFRVKTKTYTNMVVLRSLCIHRFQYAAALILHL